MQRLIHIRFRHGNKVFEPAWNRCVHLMDNTKCRITVPYRIYNNTHGKQVIYLVNGFILIDHFFINTEEMLYPSIDICLNRSILHMFGHFVYNLLDKCLTLCLTCIYLLYKVIEHFRIGIFQCQIVQFNLNLGNTKSLGDWRIDIHGFFRFFLLLLWLHVFQCTHIVQTVSQLYNNDTDILCHGKKHLTKILCLYIQLIRRIRQLSQLGNTVYDQCHFVTEFLPDFFIGHNCIFHYIV